MKLAERLNELDQKLARKYAVHVAIILAVEALVLSGLIIFLLWQLR